MHEELQVNPLDYTLFCIGYSIRKSIHTANKIPTAVTVRKAEEISQEGK